MNDTLPENHPNCGPSNLQLSDNPTARNVLLQLILTAKNLTSVDFLYQHIETAEFNLSRA